MMGIIEKAKEGKPVDDFLIIDSHCHMGYYRNFHNPGNTAEDMIKHMDVLGIDKAFITPHAASVGPDYKYGNNMAIDSVEKYPERFLGYVAINPNYVSDIANELARCFAVKGMFGIKLHPSYHGCPVDYKAYMIAYEYAHKKHCPVLIHVWGKADVAAIDAIAQSYPEAVLIMGHAGGDIRAMEDACMVVKKHPNVYLDTALSIVYQGNVEWLVENAGSDKVLFGSDMPFFDPRPAFGRVVMAKIDDEEKAKVLGLNMKRILDNIK